jgi:hypothetical protein
MRLIDADAFLRSEIERCHCVPLVGTCSNDNYDLRYILDGTPTADAAPVVHGRWVFGTSNHREWMKCSECLHSQTPTGVFVYCPNCGAKMDRKDDT